MFQVQHMDRGQQGLVRTKGSCPDPLQDGLACIRPAGFLCLPEAVDGLYRDRGMRYGGVQYRAGSFSSFSSQSVWFQPRIRSSSSDSRWSLVLATLIFSILVSSFNLIPLKSLVKFPTAGTPLKSSFYF